MAPRPLSPFRQAQYVKVFQLEPVPFWKLCWSRQHQQVCYFSYLTLVLSSPPCFLLRLVTSISLADLARTVFSPLYYQATMGPRKLVPPPPPPRNDVADELARRGALLAPSAIPCSLSLISRIYSSLLSNWRRTVSSKFFDTQVPSISLRNLCSLVTLAVSSLV